MDIKLVRKLNLLRLRDECDPQTMDELSKRTGVQRNYLYQLTTDPKNTKNPPRKMGDKAARQLECGMGKEPGWMDVPPPDYDAERPILSHLSVEEASQAMIDWASAELSPAEFLALAQRVLAEYGDEDEQERHAP